MTRRRPLSEELTIDGPEGALEALLEWPSDREQPCGAAVVCHPHPQHGGTMRNKVAHTLARSLVQLGFAALRFNFRGVGASAGAYAEGLGEVDDALAALGWMREKYAPEALWLGGFSFGACVAMRAATRVPVGQLITIAPPVERCELSELPDCPWLIVQGGADELVAADAVIDWVNSLPPGPGLSVIEDADHFFHGRLTELRDLIMENLAGAVPDTV